NVVLMIGRAMMADLPHRSGGSVMLVARRGVVLERLVMRRIVDPRRVNIGAGIDCRVRHDQHWGRAVLMVDMGGSALRWCVCRPVRVHDCLRGPREAAFEPSPGYALQIEQITDIPAGHLDRTLARGGAPCIGAAVVEGRVWVPGDGHWRGSRHLPV